MVLMTIFHGSKTIIIEELKFLSPNVKEICYSLNEEDAKKIAGSADWHVTAEAGKCWTQNVAHPVDKCWIFSWHYVLHFLPIVMQILYWVIQCNESVFQSEKIYLDYFVFKSELHNRPFIIWHQFIDFI